MKRLRAMASDPIFSGSNAKNLVIDGRSPYMLLNEACVKSKIKIKPSMASSGPPHQSRFTCTLLLQSDVENVSKEVTGATEATKKVAQQAAAVQAFNDLGLTINWYRACFNKDCDWVIPISCLKYGTPNASKPGTSPFMSPMRTPARVNAPETPVTNAPKSLSNFSYDLLDYCVEKNYSPPNYEEGDAKGQSHRPIFATDCSVTHNGSGDVIKVTVTAVEKKKTVKHMASQKLLMKLKALHGEKWDGPALTGDLSDSKNGGKEVRFPTIDSASLTASREEFDRQLLIELGIDNPTAMKSPEAPGLLEVMEVVEADCLKMASSLKMGLSERRMLESPEMLEPSLALDLLKKLVTHQSDPNVTLSFQNTKSKDNTSFIVFLIFKHPQYQIVKLGMGTSLEVAKENAANSVVQFLKKLLAKLKERHDAGIDPMITN